MTPMLAEWKPALMPLVERAVMAGHALDLEERHDFADGTYTRTLFIPKGVLVVGKVHLVQTVNICAMGDISILTARGARRFKAGEVVISDAGIQKIGVAHEDTIWVNVFANPTNERDIGRLEFMLTRDPPTSAEFRKFLAEVC